jgi:hypothetical protein
MSLDANQLTMYDYGQMSNEPLVTAVTNSFIMADNVITKIPMPVDASQKFNGVRLLGGHPDLNWIPVNSDAVAVKMVPDPYSEQIYGYRNKVLTDHIMMKDKNQIGGPGAVRAKQSEWFIDAVTFATNYLFIRNKHKGETNDEKFGPVGIRERIDNPAYSINSEMKIDAGSIDISPGCTESDAIQFFELLDKLVEYTNTRDGKDCFLCMNDEMKRRMKSLAKILKSSCFSQDTDNLNRTIERYSGAEFFDIGRTKPQQGGAQTGRVIDSFEAADGTDGTDGTDVHTSIYVVRKGPEQFGGWQFMPLAVEDLGRDKSSGEGGGWQYTTFFEHWYGYKNASTRCLGRLHGIKIR